jgi:hypothetical protein
MDFAYWLIGFTLVWFLGFVTVVSYGVTKTLTQLKAYVNKQKKTSVEDLNPNKWK